MNKLFTGLHNRLMELLDTQYDLYLEEHPFLNGDSEPAITALEEATQNQMEINLTVKAIQSEIRKSLPPVEPPKQQELLS